MVALPFSKTSIAGKERLGLNVAHIVFVFSPIHGGRLSPITTQAATRAVQPRLS